MSDASFLYRAVFRRNGRATRSARLWAGLLGMGLGSGWCAWLFWQHNIAAGLLRYADSNLPLINTPDGFLFLAAARDMLQTGITYESLTSLGAVLAWLHRLFWLPPEVLGFWLPLALSVACGVCFALWGGLFRLSPLLTGFAALLGALMPTWTIRVRLGALDTDAGIFLLWGVCLWLAARLILARGRPIRPGLFLSGFLLCTALLGWFWKQGLLLAPLSLWLWGLTSRRAKTPREALARRITAVALPVLGLAGLFLSDSLLPASLSAMRASILTHMGYIVNPRADMIYQSIAELNGLTPAAWLRGLGGSVPGGCLALFALPCLLLRHPAETLTLSPALLMLGLGFSFNRFHFFGMLPVALAVAMLPLTLPALLRRLRGVCRRLLPARLPRLTPARRRLARRALGAATLLLALLPLWQEAEHQLRFRMTFSTTRDEDAIGLALAAATRQSLNSGTPTALFHWWDEGYYLHYRTGLPPFFDGGSQNPLTAFLVAAPLTMDNTLAARRWMRYFALHQEGHGRAGWDRLVRAFGDEQTALRELLTLFMQTDEAGIRARLARWPALPDLPPGVSAQDWLFPAGRVFVYLPVRFLTFAPWWMAMGENLRPGPLRPQLVRFPSAQFRYDAKTNRAMLPEALLRQGHTRAGGLYLPSRQRPFAAPWGAEAADPLLIVSQHSPWGYLTNRQLARTLAFRLLAPSWEDIPGFALIAVNFGAAGAWEVLP